MKTWHGFVNGQDISATEDDLKRTRYFYPDNNELLSRISLLFRFHIYALLIGASVDPASVFLSVSELESGEHGSGTKRGKAFKRPPLLGLWHKHYVPPTSIAHNHHEGLKKVPVAQLIGQGLGTIAAGLNARYLKRAAAQKLTGEWITYAKHDGKNYYLSLNSHLEDEQEILDTVLQHCVADFPDLPAWIKASKPP